MSILMNDEAKITVECSEPNCKYFGIGHEAFANEPILHTRGDARGVEVWRMDDANEWTIDVDVREDLDVANAQKFERRLADATSDAANLNSALRVAGFERFGDYARHICATANVAETDLASLPKGDSERAARILDGYSEITLADLLWFGDVTGRGMVEMVLDAGAFFRCESGRVAES